MEEDKKVDLFRKILTIIAFIAIIAFVWMFSKNDFIRGEILNEGIETNIEQLKYPIHGRFLCGLLTRLIGFANNLLNIHPMTFMCSFGGFLKGLFYAGICFFMANSVNIFSKKILFATPFIILICFFTTLFLNTVEYESYTQFYGYSVCLLFYFAGCSTVFKHFSLQTKPTDNLSTLLTNSFIALFIGQSSHLENASFAILFSFVFVWFLVKFGKEEKWNISKTFSKFKNSGKGIFIPISVFFTTMICTYINSFIGIKQYNYQEVAENFVNSKFSVDFFSTFFNGYLNLLKDCLPYFVIITALLVSAFIFTKNKKLFFRFSYIELSLIFALFFFFFSLCSLNSTFYQGGIWLQHNGMRCLLNSTLIYLCFCAFGFLFNNLNTPKERTKNIILNCIAVLVLCFLTLFPSGREKIEFLLIEKPLIDKKGTKSFYVLEKMVVTYVTQSKNIYLPQSYAVFFPPEYIFTDEWMYVFKRAESESGKLEVFKNSRGKAFRLLSDIYFYNTYDLNTADYKIYFIPDEEAFEKFNKIGGTLTSEEVEENNFQNIKKYAKLMKRKYSQKNQ